MSLSSSSSVRGGLPTARSHSCMTSYAFIDLSLVVDGGSVMHPVAGERFRGARASASVPHEMTEQVDKRGK